MKLLAKLVGMVTAGFIASTLFYRTLHEDDVPEVLRYAAGCACIAPGVYIIAPEIERHSQNGRSLRALLAYVLTLVTFGAGVSLARLYRGRLWR